MNIMVIFTGGTIGSAVKNGYINTDEKQGADLLRLYAAYETSPVHFDCETPFTILSENMNGLYLQQLARCITEKLHYDGIIVTHGTDTLQYTAAGLYHLFSDIDIPIVLVSSNYILQDKRANGFANFCAAVSFIRHQLGTGIFVSYQNNTTDGSLAPVSIYQGNTLLPHTIYSDALHSLQDKYYCRILPEAKGGHITYDSYEMWEDNGENTGSVLTQLSFNPDTLKLPAESGILMLCMAPGMYFPEPKKDMKAILLITYHSGTLPTDSDAFRSFAKKAHELDIPVYIIGAATNTPYESTAVYDELHLRLLPAISPADAYMQILLS